MNGSKDIFPLRLYGGVAILFIILGVPAIMSLYSLQDIIQDKNQMVSVYSQELIGAERLRHIQMSMFAAMPAYVSSGDVSLADSFIKSHDKFKFYLKELQKTANDLQSIKILKEVSQSEEELYKRGLPAIEMRKGGASASAVWNYIKQGKDKTSRFDDAINDYVEHKSMRFAVAKEESIHTAKTISHTLAVAMFLALFLALTIAGLLGKLINEKRKSDLQLHLLYQQERKLSLSRKETVEVVAHDLKSPLATIQMSIDLLKERLMNVEDPMVHEGTSIAIRSADRMTKLINDLLDHAKIEAGTLTLEKAPCSLTRLITQQTHELSYIIAESKLQLFLDLDDDDPELLIDQHRLDQVISNLLGNAIKFTPAGGTIKVTSRCSDLGVVVSVKDTGSGIDKEFLPHVFERFAQVKDTSKLGTGLGLAIVKAVVEAHGGKVWVNSTVGHGSIFSFLIPYGEAQRIGGRSFRPPVSELQENA